MKGKRIDLLFDNAFALLLFFLPISQAVPNIILLILVLLFIFKKSKQQLNTPILIFCLLVFYLFIKSVFFGSFISGIHLYKQLGLLLAVGVLIQNVSKINNLLNGFLLGVLAAIIISCWNIFYFYFKHGILPLGNTTEASDLLIIHRPYFGFICFLSIVLVSKLLETTSGKKIRIGYFIFSGILTLFAFFIVARLSIGLIVLFVFYKLITTFKKSKLKIAISLALSIGVICVLLFTSENIKKRFHIQNSINKTIAVVKNQEPRFVIWKCVINQINTPGFNLIFGNANINSTQSKLTNCFEEIVTNKSKKEYYLRTKFNTHNQFFDLFLQGGLIALLLLLGLFSMLLYNDKFKSTYWVIVVGFFAFAFLENIFHRQLGVYLFGIFIFLNDKGLLLAEK